MGNDNQRNRQKGEAAGERQAEQQSNDQAEEPDASSEPLDAMTTIPAAGPPADDQRPNFRKRAVAALWTPLWKSVKFFGILLRRLWANLTIAILLSFLSWWLVWHGFPLFHDHDNLVAPSDFAKVIAVIQMATLAWLFLVPVFEYLKWTLDKALRETGQRLIVGGVLILGFVVAVLLVAATTNHEVYVFAFQNTLVFLTLNAVFLAYLGLADMTLVSFEEARGTETDLRRVEYHGDLLAHADLAVLLSIVLTIGLYLSVRQVIAIPDEIAEMNYRRFFEGATAFQAAVSTVIYLGATYRLKAPDSDL